MYIFFTSYYYSCSVKTERAKEINKTPKKKKPDTKHEVLNLFSSIPLYFNLRVGPAYLSDRSVYRLRHRCKNGTVPAPMKGNAANTKDENGTTENKQ